MKILFLKNVPRQGQAGEVKELSQGFASFILKSGAGIVATDSVIKQNQKKIEEATMKAKGEESYAQEVSKRLEGQIIVIKGGANSKGNLYKAIHKDDILTAISKEVIVNVPESLIPETSIKLTGEHEIKMTYKGKDLGKFKILIS
jgi:large subunit ribosomal protein L9